MRALPFWHYDQTVEVRLRASTYPYAGGDPRRGLQITLEGEASGTTLAARLPVETARALAHAILMEVEP